MGRREGALDVEVFSAVVRMFQQLKYVEVPPRLHAAAMDRAAVLVFLFFASVVK